MPLSGFEVMPEEVAAQYQGNKDSEFGNMYPALFAAADEDAATGGPDLVRRIFPSVAVISHEGFVPLDDATIAGRSEVLYGGREEGSGL